MAKQTFIPTLLPYPINKFQSPTTHPQTCVRSA
jgi:hypothetical protein